MKCIFSLSLLLAINTSLAGRVIIQSEKPHNPWSDKVIKKLINDYSIPSKLITKIHWELDEIQRQYFLIFKIGNDGEISIDNNKNKELILSSLLIFKKD